MGYQEAMEAAGAEVLAFESFGSYQGDWWALVRFDGRTGWVRGSYGSCSGCDAFEAEFGYDDKDPKKLAAFGKGYLDWLMTQQEAEAAASENASWDMETDKVLAFLKNNAYDVLVDTLERHFPEIVAARRRAA